MTIPYVEHELLWDDDKIQRFWDFLADHPAYRTNYFSKMVGRSVIGHVRRAGIRMRGNILDFGCGPGHMLEHMILQGIPCEGVDFSPRSVTETRARLTGRDGFRGVNVIAAMPSHLPNAHFDLVLCLEMIEHLNDDYMTKAVNEFHRILKPDGVLVLTTPNNEDLSVGEVLCAECGARFHRMQHVRSWTADALREEMEGSGFETIRCRSVYFTQPTAASHLKAVAYRLGGLKTPNLLYFGRRRPSK